MADQNYVIELILNARDNASQALSDFADKIGALNDVQKEAERTNQEFTRSYENMASRISNSQRELRDRETDLIKQQGLSAQQRETIVKQYSAIEQASQSYVRTLSNANATEAQRVISLQNLRKAQEEYGRALDEDGKKITIIDQKERDLAAQRIARDSAERERLRQRTQMLSQAAAEEDRIRQDSARKQQELNRLLNSQIKQAARETADLRKAELQAYEEDSRRMATLARERANAQKETNRILNAEIRQAAQETKRLQDEEARRERESAQRRKEQIAEERRLGQERTRNLREEARSMDEATRQINEAVKKIASPDINIDEYRKLQREIVQIRQEMIKMGADGAQVQNRIGQAFRASNAEMSKARALQLEQMQLGEKQLDLETRRIAVARDYASAVEEAGRAETERLRIRNDPNSTNAQVIKVDADIRQATAKLQEVAREAFRIGAINPNVDVTADISEVVAAAAEVEALKRQMSESSNTDGFFTRLKNNVAEAGDKFENSSNRIAAFDNYLRGLMSLGITLFLQQLIVVAGSAGGALLALASSAGFAASALGGLATAAIAQAAPALGMLATFASRLSAVQDALKAADALQQQQATSSEQLGNRQARANDQIARALRGIESAQRRVNEARREAARQLTDLVLAEQRAELQAKGAVLSQEEAQRALRRAISSGQTGDIERRRLDVQSANLGVRESTVRVGRASADANRARSQGVEGSDQVRAAQESAQSAAESLDNARRSAENAGDASQSAAQKLDFLLGKLSESERDLYRAMTEMQSAFRGFAREVTEPLTIGMTAAVQRITSILRDPEIRNSARGFAEELSTQFGRVFNAFTSGEGLAQIMRIVEQSKDNLEPLTDIILNLGQAFLDIAESAGPSLSLFLDWIKDLTGDFRNLIDEASGNGTLTDFFKDGLVHLQAWVEFLGAIGGLFFAIAGPGGGAESGLGILEAMTEKIRDWTDEISDADSKTNDFFQRFFDISRDVLAALAPIFESLADEIDQLFNDDAVSSVEGFAEIFANILIPAIFDMIHFVGDLTTAIGDFLKHNPEVSEFAGIVLGMSLSFFALSKASAIFAPLARIFLVVGKAASTVAEALGVEKGIGGALSRLVGNVTRGQSAFRLFAGATGIGLLIGAITFLLIKFGLVDDIMRGVGRAFRTFINSVAPGFEDLKDAFAEVSSALNSEDGVMPLLKDLMTFFTGAFVDSLVIVARILGGVVNGAFIAIAGTIRVVARLLRGDFSGAFRALRETIGKLIRNIADTFSDILPIVRNLGRRIVSMLWEGISAGGSVIAGLPGWMIDLIGDAIHGLGSALESLGERIIRAIVRGIKKAPGIVGNAIRDLLPDGIENAAGAVGNLFRNQGGPIPGQGSSDTVPAMLTPGEHVWTKDEVERAGGHGVMYALRAFFGGGGQGGPQKFARGGAVGGGSISVEIDSAQIASFSEQWRDMWNSIVTTTRRSTSNVENQIRDMRTATNRTMDRMYRDTRRSFSDIEESGTTRSARMVRNVGRSMDSMAKSVYQGMRYVATTTNASLKAFDADPVQVSIDTPPSGNRAATGYIGMRGERGGDAIPIMVGRGEAVLNWAHQSMIEPALRAYYGLGLHDIFHKTHAYHAGGPQNMGYAKGGFTGPAGSGSAFNAVANFAKSKFGLTMTSGKDNHGKMTASGNVSDHWYGRAGDFSNGFAPTPQMDAFSNFWKSKLPQVISQLIWRDKVQAGSSLGATVPGHMNHVHLGLLQQYAFDLPRMAKLISRSSRGLSIQDLLSNISGEGGETADHVDPIKVRGKGVIARLLRKALDKVRKSANSLIDSKFGTTATAGSGPNDASYEGGVLSRAEATKIINQAMGVVGIPSALKDRWRSMALARAWQESSFNPNIQNNWDSNAAKGTPSIGFFQTIQPTFDAYNREGMNNIRNPLHNAVAAFNYMRARYGRGNWSQALNSMLQIKGGYAGGGFPNGIPGFARGGFTGGFPTMRRAAGGVLQVGDSLGVGTDDWLNKLVDKLTARNRESRTSSQGIEVLRQSLNDSISKVIFDLGTNDGTAAQLAANIKRALRLVGEDRQLIIPTVEGPQAAAKNQAIRRLAAQHSNINVVDWAGQNRGLLASDGIHATGAGYKERANQLAATIRDGVSDAIKKVTSGAGPFAAERDRITNIRRTGEYEAPDILPESFAGARAEGSRAVAQLGRRAKETLQKANDRIYKNLKELTDEGGVFDQLGEAVERQLEVLANRLAKSRFFVDRSTGQVRQNLNADQTLQGELNNLVEGYNMLNSLGSRIRTALRKNIEELNATNRRIRQLERRGERRTNAEDAELKELGEDRKELISSSRNLRDRQRENDAAIAQALQDRYEKQVEIFQKGVQNTLDIVSNTDVERRQRVAQAFGRTGEYENLEAVRMNNLRAQAGVLADAAQRATAAGYHDQAREYFDQMMEINTTIQEGVAAAMQRELDAINTAADLAKAATDRQGRIIDIRERIGTIAGGGGSVAAAQARLANAQQLGNGQQAQLSGLWQAFINATASGNQGLAAQIREQISELEVAIQETVASFTDLNEAVRTARINQITGRQQFQGGVFSGINSLLEAFDQNNSGNSSASRLRNLESIQTLTQSTLERIAGELQAFGVNVAGMNGEQIAEVLRNVNYDYMEANLPAAAYETFQNLINALIDTATNLEGTTAAIKELNGQMTIQTFTSRSWELWRNAIFNGNGGLMAQYETPFTNGGIQTTSLAGGTINNSRSASTVVENNNYNFTQPMEVADPVVIGSQVAWARRNEPRN